MLYLYLICKINKNKIKNILFFNIKIKIIFHFNNFLYYVIQYIK